MKSWASPIRFVAVVGLLCQITLSQNSGKDRVAAPADEIAPPPDSIIQQLKQGQLVRRNPSTYTVVRDFRITGGDGKSVRAEVTAALQFSPEKNSYTIQKHSGSLRGTEVVRRVLEHELAASGDKAQSSAALSAANYDFRYNGEAIVAAHPCYLLELIPKRKQRDLLIGHAWIDRNTFEVRRIEGDLAKSPSFWLKKVHVIVVFGDVSGSWLQTGMSATADVRLLGRHTLTSNLVDFKTPEMVAQRTPAIDRAERPDLQQQRLQRR